MRLPLRLLVCCLVSIAFLISVAAEPAPVVTPPRVIRSVEAQLSEAARQRGVAGCTVVALVVDTDGMPRSVRVERSAGDGQPARLQKAAASLDAAAVKAVEQFRFSPAIENGQPVAVALQLAVSFAAGTR